jgi:alkylation response protein AidB-like acyl-CoA dehydrogenase
MDLLPTHEQDEIVASVRAVLADRHTTGEPMSPELWSTAAAQGWFGLGLAESDGGVGYSVVEEALLCIELGRACVPGPFLGTILASHCDDAELRASVIAGEAPVGLAEREGDGVRVFDGVDDGHALLLDDGQIVRLGTLSAEPSIDLLVGLATAEYVSSVAPGPGRDRTTLLAAAYLSGIAAATAAQSVEYGKDREQFGQPVGGFQAVKHRCADMAVRAEASTTQVHYAALALRDGTADASFHVEAAAVVAAQSAVANAEINVQNHGGIGFTLEHTAHRYVTRARILAAVAGGLRRHQADLLAAPIA